MGSAQSTWGQIKNIKLHIVTDIKVISLTEQPKMHKILRPQRLKRYQNSRKKRTTQINGSRIMQVKSIVSLDENDQSASSTQYGLPEGFDLDGDWEVVEDDEEDGEGDEGKENNGPEKETMTTANKDGKPKKNKIMQVVRYLSKEYGTMIELVILLPLTLMAFYILFIEKGTLFLKDNTVVDQ